MRLTDKWNVHNFKKPHLCTIFTDRVEEDKNKEKKEVRTFSMSPTKMHMESRLRLSNQEVKNRLNASEKSGRKDTSSEIRRNRVRSKALGEESEFFIGNREYRENANKIKLRKKLSENEDLQGRFS